MEEYKFVGVVNLFDLYPAFLFPIYEKENKLYFHNGDKNIISNFEPITESIKSKIIYLSEGKFVIANKAHVDGYFLEGEPAYSFQKNMFEIFCANLVDMMDYLFFIKTDDEILKRQIKEFIQENVHEYLAKVNNCNRMNGKVKIALKDKEGEVRILEMEIQEQEKMLRDAMEYHKSFAEDMHNDFFPVVVKSMSNALKSNVGADLLKNFRYHSLLDLQENINRRLQNLASELEFVKLKKEFDSIIKITPYNSMLYDICIKCQNAIIVNDEQELINILRSNYYLFYEWLKEERVGKDLLNYLQKNVSTYTSDNVPNNL